MNPTLFYTVLPEREKKQKRPSDSLHDASYDLLNRGFALLYPSDDKEREPLRISRTPFGKPYLAEYPDVHISLSHAGNIAVCVFAGEEIGVDVQDHRPIGPRRLMQIADRFFSPKERTLLHEAESDERPLLFFRLWAAKEAYVKYTGKGMREDFSAFTADLDTMTAAGDGKPSAVLRELFFAEGCSLFLCTGNPVGDITCTGL